MIQNYFLPIFKVQIYLNLSESQLNLFFKSILGLNLSESHLNDSELFCTNFQSPNLSEVHRNHPNQFLNFNTISLSSSLFIQTSLHLYFTSV